MLTSEYGKRVIALFESGKASKAQKAELVEAVLSALGRNTDDLKAIHRAIGWPEDEKVERARVVDLANRYAHAETVLA